MKLVHSVMQPAEKRGQLIDDLLESPGYVSHFYNYWADILRLKEWPGRDMLFDPAGMGENLDCREGPMTNG